VVAAVGDPEVAFGVDRYGVGRAELAVAGSRFAELAEVFARRVELLDAVVVLLGDPDVARGVEGDSGGTRELAVAGSRFAEGGGEGGRAKVNTASLPKSRSGS